MTFAIYIIWYRDGAVKYKGRSDKPKGGAINSIVRHRSRRYFVTDITA